MEFLTKCSFFFHYSSLKKCQIQLKKMQAEMAEKKKEDEVSEKFNRKLLKIFNVQIKCFRIVLFMHVRKINSSRSLSDKINYLTTMKNMPVKNKKCRLHLVNILRS